MNLFLPRIHADCRGLFHRYAGISHIYQAGIVLIASVILVCISGCEKRIVMKQERIFMDYAEEHWSKLTPRQKADYYEMIERQKERARKEGDRGKQRGY